MPTHLNSSFGCFGTHLFPLPNLHSADELFSDGFLLPLHLLNLSDDPNPPPPPHQTTASSPPEATGSDQVPEHEAPMIESADLSANPSSTSSKRWKDIFKKGEKKSSRLFNGGNADDSSKDKDISNSSREKKREKKNGAGSSKGASAAELNINIWPFSRSRSAGNGAARPRSAVTTRKVSSAPCSRSNSSGESKSRKWPSSPSRAGVHLGRSSPVWQVHRGGSGRRSDTFGKNPPKGIRKDGKDGSRRTLSSESVGGRSKARVLSLNVPMCIGYRQQLSCRSDENSAVAVATTVDGGGVSGYGLRGGNLFNIRSVFPKKVFTR
ncbi:hypothetical protein F511_13272 [Dorcoceras hygrometricum]|uniref:Uncharacterized protein n=1 Tax=Dorcoceras hygrometricum TaxID=472368 RepID=A0A2Z7A3T6_9LAMI|nr:hypothetical protein F511_13272 [Dorcoceras hygrometricum]